MKFLISITILFILSGCSMKYNFQINEYKYGKEKINYNTKYGNKIKYSIIYKE